MFNLHYSVYEKAEELGKVLAESEVFKTLQAAESAGEADADLSASVAAFMEKRQQLEEETMKDSKDFHLIGALSREVDEESEKMKSMPAYQKIIAARSDFTAMMNAVNEVLQACLYPDAASAACSGDCSRCHGCDLGK